VYAEDKEFINHPACQVAAGALAVFSRSSHLFLPLFFSFFLLYFKAVITREWHGALAPNTSNLTIFLNVLLWVMTGFIPIIHFLTPDTWLFELRSDITHKHVTQMRDSRPTAPQHHRIDKTKVSPTPLFSQCCSFQLKGKKQTKNQNKQTSFFVASIM
jgi:hypothetical protein